MKTTEIEKVTPGQIDEMTDWLKRLSKEEYQKRRGLLRRVTDPKQAMDAKLLYPFNDQRPLEWGWKGVEREGAIVESLIDISKLELVVFHREGEDWVSGADMLRRSADETKFPGCQGWGQHAAEDILSRASELPTEWANDNKGPVLLFADTVLVSDGGDRLVPCLCWIDGQWQLYWYCLDYGFSRDYHFVRLRPPASPAQGEASK
jgi:hypothetical protein